MATSTPKPPAPASSARASERPTGPSLSAGQESILRGLRDKGLPETRENYIRLALGRDPVDDEEWGAEMEGQLPAHLQERE